MYLNTTKYEEQNGEFKRWDEWNKQVLVAVFSNRTPKQCLPLQRNIPPDF